MTTAILDAFTDLDFTDIENHVPTIGDGWQRHPAWPTTPVFIQNDLLVSSHANRPILVTDDLPDDYDIRADFHVDPNAGEFGLLARCDDSVGQTYGFTYKGGKFEFWRLAINQYGNLQRVVLDSVTPNTFLAGVYQLLVLVGGNQFQALVVNISGANPKFLKNDGSWTGFPSGPSLIVSDSTLATGQPGLWLTNSYLDSNGNSVTANADEFEVQVS